MLERLASAGGWALAHTALAAALLAVALVGVGAGCYHLARADVSPRDRLSPDDLGGTHRFDYPDRALLSAEGRARRDRGLRLSKVGAGAFALLVLQAWLLATWW